MDEKILKKSFWCFAFNKAKSQLVPLNQKLTIMPNSGIMVNCSQTIRLWSHPL
ncbi:hypothetical protein IV78_GL000677 [Pediococcus acidilactici]|nr:hypothetical protein IV78_GL000677 [Pediococcus acidilactici]